MTLAVSVICIFMVIVRGQDSVQIEEETTELCSNGTEDICEAFNTTELSTLPSTVEVTSVVSKKRTTSKKPKTTTAKTMMKKTAVHNSSTPVQPHPECSCDLTRGGCEVNCCCDVDCSAGQRLVFTHCIVVPQAVDREHCFPPHLLYRNNTDHQTVETEPGVLCVVQQNTFTSTDFRDVPVMRTLTTFKKKISNHKYYSWAKSQPSVPVFELGGPYGDGSPIWISDHLTVSHLAFPVTAGHSTECLSSVVPKYLEEIETSCIEHLRTEEDCLRNSFTNFTVISEPQNFNFTGPQECTEDVCLPIHQFVCTKSCTEVEIPRTKFNSSNHMCLNLIESVAYEVYHNGSEGIVAVRAFYSLENVTVHEDQLVRKRYRITYKWAGSNGQQVFKRSGHPGYERGRPIILGIKATKAVVFNTSEADWISVGVSGNSGYCSERQNLLFKENLRTKCRLKVNGTCKQIQQQIWQQIVVSHTNLSELVLSSYGDPQEGDREAWVPLLISDLPPPPALSSIVDIVLVYTLVGPVARPQAKIIGAFFHLLPPKATCDSNLTEVWVETSVKFVDKTIPPVTKFAPPPVYEIKLPQDFFYPFLSSGSRVYFVTRLFTLMTFSSIRLL